MGGDTPVSQAINARAARRGMDPVAAWLFTVAAMIYAMVVLGGLTRLTESGLSMVDWRPLTGWLPPLSDAAWQDVFARYQSSPQYRDVNAGMTLAGFKEIFWLEYLHRLFGRVIGVVFGLPFLFFLATGRLAGLKARCAVMFALGGLQGLVGWWMVKSGLVDNPAVSQYRLATHLGLALAIYLFILWTAFDLVRPRPAVVPAGQGGVAGRAAFLLAFAFLTVLSGALVAGLDAGLIFNTFPLMDGGLWPDEAFRLKPFVLNFFEDRATVQFDHRVLAVTTVVLVAVNVVKTLGTALPDRMKSAAGLLVAAVLVQASLGISTLLLVVPVPLAALHQAGAVLVLTAALWFLHQARR